MPAEKNEAQNHGAHKAPVVEERLLHSHHREKKVRMYVEFLNKGYKVFTGILCMLIYKYINKIIIIEYNKF